MHLNYVYVMYQYVYNANIHNLNTQGKRDLQSGL